MRTARSAATGANGEVRYYAASGHTMTVSDSRFSSNRANTDGAIFINFSSM